MFQRLDRCWVCGATTLTRYHECRFDFREYAAQDPELHAYTGKTIWLVRCCDCGFGQPEALPTLAAFFDRMYDQRWHPDWIEREFEAGYKDFIFRRILDDLGRRTNGRSRRLLLDIGAHAGRFLSLAQASGWDVEGIELNPRTAACAARRTGALVHCMNAHQLSTAGRRYTAVTLNDVLEHIPDPVQMLATIARLVEPGGWIAVKVPSGPGQWQKERLLAGLAPGREMSLAGNLVHVNHFSARSLGLALERAGFHEVTIGTGAPELLPLEGVRVKHAVSNAVRLAVYGAGRLPGAVRTPLALNLQAYARLPIAS
jgi:SAM-dependent methyltransferase